MPVNYIIMKYSWIPLTTHQYISSHTEVLSRIIFSDRSYKIKIGPAICTIITYRRFHVRIPQYPRRWIWHASSRTRKCYWISKIRTNDSVIQSRLNNFCRYLISKVVQEREMLVNSDTSGTQVSLYTQLKLVVEGSINVSKDMVSLLVDLCVPLIYCSYRLCFIFKVIRYRWLIGSYREDMVANRAAFILKCPGEVYRKWAIVRQKLSIEYCIRGDALCKRVFSSTTSKSYYVVCISKYVTRMYTVLTVQSLGARKN